MFAHIHAGDQAPDEIFLLGEQRQRAGPRTPDQQAAKQHRGGRRAWHAERNHRQQRGRAGGVRRGLRRDHAFNLAFTEILPALEMRLAMP